MANKNMIRMGGFYKLNVSGAPDVVQSVEPGVYTIEVSDKDVNLCLKQLAFKQPAEVLGDAKKIASTIAGDFFSNPNKPLGAIFQGVKGSGKSLTSELIANSAIEAGLPVVLIDSNYSHNLLDLVVSKIGRCVLLFDEFEKRYEEEYQEKLLTFFSDQSNEGVLSIVICNDDDKLTSYILNRPGRFKYRVKFETLDKDVFKEILTSWGLTDRMHTFLSAAYGNDTLTYDSLLTLKKYMLDAVSPVDYIEKTLLLNVPKPAVLWPSFYGAVYKGQDVREDEHMRFEMKYDADMLMTIEVIGDHGYSHTFERLDFYKPHGECIDSLDSGDYVFDLRTTKAAYRAAGRSDNCPVKEEPAVTTSAGESTATADATPSTAEVLASKHSSLTQMLGRLQSIPMGKNGVAPNPLHTVYDKDGAIQVAGKLIRVMKASSRGSSE